MHLTSPEHGDLKLIKDRQDRRALASTTKPSTKMGLTTESMWLLARRTGYGHHGNFNDIRDVVL